MCRIDRKTYRRLQHDLEEAEKAFPELPRAILRAVVAIPVSSEVVQSYSERVSGVIAMSARIIRPGNCSRPEGDKSITRSKLWPRFAATQVPADASVD
jgi:hypothetical protein